jgi:hypothetical protein
MRLHHLLRVLPVLLLAGVFAAGAGAAANGVLVSPSSGTPRSVFTVSFLVPLQSGAVGATRRNYQVSAQSVSDLTPTSCAATFSTTAAVSSAGVRVSVHLHPSHNWCLGTYTGRVSETVTPVCAPTQPCPQYMMLHEIGSFTFLVYTSCVPPVVPLPAHEPVVRRGPTRLISGIYLRGGPIIIGCPDSPHGPLAGTLTATSVGTTERMTVSETLHKAGELFRLDLSPGTYNVSATLAGNARTLPVRVTIPAGRSVRQDVFVIAF